MSDEILDWYMQLGSLILNRPEDFRPLTFEEQQALRCLTGSHKEGSDQGMDWMWLLGWADWATEVELLTNHEDK